MRDHAITVETASRETAEVRALISELDRTLAAEYAPEQRHGLAFDAIFAPGIRFFVARLDGVAQACGGVQFFDGYGEVKRMYVRELVRGRGLAQSLLARIETETRARGITVLRLETGVRQAAAIKTYHRAGFRPCAPFGAYVTMDGAAVATSVFFEKRLT